MWHTEVDDAGTSFGQLGVARTYNSNPLNWDAAVARSFGTRWTFAYDAILKPEAAFEPNTPVGTCYQRQDTLEIFCENPSPASSSPIPEAVSILRGDGKKYLFNHSGSSWVSDRDVNDRITARYTADGSAVTGWAYVSARGDVTERYDAAGLLISTTSRSGVVQQLTYSNGATNDSSAGRNPAAAPVCSHVQAGTVLPAGRLLCVTDHWGRQLNFEYDGNGRITQAIDPAGQAIIYAYDGPSGGCTGEAGNLACSAGNLTSVTYPDGKTRLYFYNEASQINDGVTCPNVISIGNGFGHLINTLTGIVDENGARYIRWTYDCAGKALSSQVGNGMEKVALAYGTPDASGHSTTTVTHYVGDPANPQTTVRHYQYQAVLNVPKNIGIDGPCVECGAIQARSYDANGNTASTTDWNGNITTYTYDLTRNLEASRTEAAGTLQARTISTQWHPTYRLPTVIAEPKRLSIYSYDSSGNLLTRKEQATGDTTGSQGFAAAVVGTPRTWSYTYNSVGQVLTATGPRTDVLDQTTYTYDDHGNLATVTNAAGQVTTLSNYDANGRAGRITDPNGLITDLTYSPRGWLTQRSVSDGLHAETTTYAYDGVGQLISAALPDTTVTYTYDDAHRLTDVSDNLGNTLHYTLDAMGNRIKEETKDPAGTLARQVTRVYDALNRLQQVTGGVQ